MGEWCYIEPMENATFVHLHVHSEFSLLDGAVRVPRLLDACAEHHSAIALTDKGNLFGAIDFYFGAKSKGFTQLWVVNCFLLRI